MNGPIWWLVLAATFLAPLEILSAVFMLRWTFAFGVPVWRGRAPLTTEPLMPFDFTTANVKVKFLGDGRWIFRRPLRVLAFQTPFPLMGTVRLNSGQLHVVGRHPLGGLLFFVAFAVIVFPGGLLVAIAFYVVSWLVERPRFESDWREVSEALGTRRARRT